MPVLSVSKWWLLRVIEGMLHWIKQNLEWETILKYVMETEAVQRVRNKGEKEEKLHTANV